MYFTFRPHFEFLCLVQAGNIQNVTPIFTFYGYFTCNFGTPQLEKYQKSFDIQATMRKSSSYTFTNMLNNANVRLREPTFWLSLVIEANPCNLANAYFELSAPPILKKA